MLPTIVLAGVVAGVQLAAAPTAGAAPAAPKAGSGTGFTIPFSGPSRYEGPAPTQATDPSQVNTLLAPGGYLDTWLLNNGAKRTWAMLYGSPCLLEAAYGFVAQQISGKAQLVPNVKGGVRTTVGMSMAPALWLVNFILIYTLNPDVAAYMAAYWTPIPENVVAAIRTRREGRVQYADYRSSFPQS